MALSYRSRMTAISAHPAIQIQPTAAENSARVLCALFLLIPLANGVFGWFAQHGGGHPSVTVMMIFKLQIVFPVFALAFIATSALGGLDPSKEFLRMPRFAQATLGITGIIAIVNGSLFAPEPLHALTRALLWMIALAFGFTISAMARQLDTLWYRRFALSVIGGMLAYTALLVAFVVTRDVAGTMNWVEAMPGHHNVRYMGYAYAAACAVTLGCFTQTDPRKESPWVSAGLVVSVTLFMAVLFWSGSRGGVLAVLAAAGALACFRPGLFKKIVGALLLGVIGGALLSTLHAPPDPHFGILRFTQRFGGDIADLSIGRVLIWKSVIPEILSNPWLGYGEGQMKFLIPEADYTFLHPHNIVLQLLLAWGIPAGLALMGIMTRGWFYALKGITTDKPARLPLFMMLSAILAHSFLDGTLFFAQSMLLAAAAAGLVLSEARRT